MVKKIVIIGPESTGKSTLCELLAQHYGMQWCPEFAREYLLTNGKEYDFDDLLTIAKGQLAMEDEYTSLVKSQWSLGNDRTWVNPHSLLTTSTSPLLFIDTDMYVMKVWCEYVFEKCHQFILDQIVSREYDLYLLCNTDLPWV
ncbi:MAG: ATP-binding protein, partial [Sediminibacterium sp.]